MVACSVDGCIRDGRVVKGMCLLHYQMMFRHGRVEKIKATSKEIWEWVFSNLNTQSEDCLYWPFGKIKTGYGQITKDGKKTYAHRVMCELVNGKPEGDANFALHSCGRGKESCVNPKHLYWGTVKQNYQDAVAHGAISFGLERYNGKLSDAQVEEIRRLRGTTTTYALAARYGISRQHITAIQTGRRRRASKQEAA